MQNRTDWLSLTVFALSLAGTLLGLGATSVLLIFLLIDLATGNSGNALSVAWAAASLGTVSLLGVPMAYWTGRKILQGKSPIRTRPAAAWAAIAFLFPIAIAAGYLTSEKGILPGILGPTAQVLAAGIPAALIALIARRISQAITPTRAWGHFLMGLWASPVLALAFEAALLVVLGIVLFAGLAFQPGIQDLLRELSMNPGLPPGMINDSLTTILLNPWTVVCILAFIAVLVPMLEEGIKILGVAPFLRLPLTPSEAFLGGTLAGLGYALFEALFLPQPGAGWAQTMLARVGATLMHAFTAGLTGWAIAEAAVRRRAGPILLAYPGAVAIHGTWNACAVTVGLAAVAAEAGQREITDPPYAIAAVVASAILLILTIGAVAGIAAFSRRLRPRPADDEPPSVQNASGASSSRGAPRT